jgi:uncharacterized membrane protein
MLRLSNKCILVLITTTALLAFQNCAPLGSSPGASDDSLNSIANKATFQWLNDYIVEPKCVACHNSSVSFGGLEFTSYEGVMESVVPGEPSASSFYTRSFTTTFFQLTPEERDVIYAWIEAGAPFN